MLHDASSTHSVLKKKLLHAQCSIGIYYVWLHFNYLEARTIIIGLPVSQVKMPQAVYLVKGTNKKCGKIFCCACGCFCVYNGLMFVLRLIEGGYYVSQAWYTQI